MAAKLKTTNLSSSDKDEEFEIHHCGSCSQEVLESDHAILCDMCGFWHHINCEKMEKSVYKFLQKNANSSIQWYCQKCNRTAKTLLRSLSDMAIRQKQLEERIDTMEDTTNRKFEKYVMKEEFEEFAKTVSHPPNDVVQLAVEEIYERERRADNLILFNVTESTSDVVEERKDHDIGEVIDICKALDVDVSSKLEKPTRLGKKTEDQPRPLRVTVNDAEVKRKIRSKAKNLQNLPTMSQVYTANDLTPIERKLLKEKKKKQNPPSSQPKQMTSTTREQVDQSVLQTILNRSST